MLKHLSPDGSGLFQDTQMHRTHALTEWFDENYANNIIAFTKSALKEHSALRAEVCEHKIA